MEQKPKDNSKKQPSGVGQGEVVLRYKESIHQEVPAIKVYSILSLKDELTRSRYYSMMKQERFHKLSETTPSK